MTSLASSFLLCSFLFLQVMRTTIKSRMGSKFGKIGVGTEELAAPECLKKPPLTYNGRNVVTTLDPNFWMNLLHSYKYQGQTSLTFK